VQIMTKTVSGTVNRFTAFCAEHQAETSQIVRATLVGSAILLAIVAFLMRALVAHPLPPMDAALMGSAAYGGFDAMALPSATDMADQPPIDATAMMNGMFLAITIVTGGFACFAFLAECLVRAGALAHRFAGTRKLPEAEGGD
jgi:hypothetical protein